MNEASSPAAERARVPVQSRMTGQRSDTVRRKHAHPPEERDAVFSGGSASSSKSKSLLQIQFAGMYIETGCVQKCELNVFSSFVCIVIFALNLVKYLK